MHLSRILDQIKRHPSPTEALTKLGKAMINMKIICWKRASEYLNQNSVLMYTKL